MLHRAGDSIVAMDLQVSRQLSSGRGSFLNFQSLTQPTSQIILVSVLAFGPYVYSGIRTEQIAIYACLGASAVRCRGLRWAFRPSPLPILTPLLFMLIVSAVALINAPRWLGQVPGDPLAALDNALLPIATISLAALWLLAGDRATLLRNLCISAVSVLTLVSAVAIIQAIQPEQALIHDVLGRFWTPSGSGSVAELAMGNRRFTGPLNQPAEAGIAFGLGLFASIYLTRCGLKFLFLQGLAFGFLLIGGLLAQSKLFYLVALPIALASMALGRTQRLRVIGSGLIAASVVAVGLMTTGLFEPLGYTRSFLNTTTLGSLSGLTAGRFGGSGVVDQPLAYVLTHSPLYGLGLTYFGSQNDSEWLRIVGGSGLLGLMAFIAVLGILAYRLLRNATVLPEPARWLAGSVLAMSIVGSFGIPVLSANRAGTLICLVLALALGALPSSSTVPLAVSSLGRQPGRGSAVPESPGTNLRTQLTHSHEIGERRPLQKAAYLGIRAVRRPRP